MKQIGKHQFYKLGGLSNPKLWRKQLKNGQWAYYADYS